MTKEKFIGTKFIIVLSMVVFGILGTLMLASLSSYDKLFNDTLNTVGDGYKITGLFSSAFVFGIIVYVLAFLIVIAITVSLFLNNKPKKLDIIILIVVSSLLLLSVFLVFIYNVVGNSLIKTIILDLRGSNQNTVSYETTVSEQISLVQTIFKPFLSIISETFIYVTPICFLGLVILFNNLTYNKTQLNNEKPENNKILASDSPENMAQKILSDKINEANEKLKTKQLEIEYENVLKKLKEIENK